MIQIEIKIASDWDDIKPLLHELQAFEKSLRPQRKDADSVIDGALRYVHDNVVAHQGACFIARDAHKRAIGFIAGWVVSGDGLDCGDNRIGEISDAYVVPDCRRQGVLTQLLAAMEDHFRRQGITRLGIYTLAANQVMQQALSRAAFRSHKLYFEMILAQTGS